MSKSKKVLLFSFFWCSMQSVYGWGFYAHRKINQQAVYMLPPGMFSFYKYHIQYLSDNAVNPDKRRYVVKGEDLKHFIHVDYYGVKKFRHQQFKKPPTGEIRKQGMLPWHLCRMRYWLIRAFREKNTEQILRLSADIGHYIADAHVPLHTTQNYNGQLTQQHGIHGLWETRIPELFWDGYEFWVGKASYINIKEAVWKAIAGAHACVSEALAIEKALDKTFPFYLKYGFEPSGSSVKRVYSRAYTKAYHDRLNGQVEQQAKAAIKMIGDYWYTCWVLAGQPELSVDARKRVKKEERFEEQVIVPRHEACAE